MSYEVSEWAYAYYGVSANVRLGEFINFVRLAIDQERVAGGGGRRLDGRGERLELGALGRFVAVAA